MEFISGKLKIHDIFSDNNNWLNFVEKYKNKIRDSVIENVAKVLACRKILGKTTYNCDNCESKKITPHSCKSRFCTTCGKVATDKWIHNIQSILPDVIYQHITFTIPDEYWPLFRANRSLLNELPRIAAEIILELSKSKNRKKQYLPGIFAALHTYGRDLKFNAHVHLTTTVGGFLFGKTPLYIHGKTFHHQTLKNMWKYRITLLLKTQFIAGTLKPTKELEHNFIDINSFNSWLNSHYKKQWNVFCQKTQKGPKQASEYIGKYLKKPPLAEARILSYKNNVVTFRFLDHTTKTYKTKSLPIEKFIQSLIIHIPEKYFKMVRYYGFLSNRTRSKYMKLLNANYQPVSKLKTSFTYLLKKTHHLTCECCGGTYIITNKTYSSLRNVIETIYSQNLNSS